MSERATDGGVTVDVDAIERVTAELPVRLAVLYGSQARGTATAGSDVDVGIAFDESLSSRERTRTRLAAIERLSSALGTDDVDVTPIKQASPELRREIRADGVVLVGSQRELDELCGRGRESGTHGDRLAEFDDLLDDIARVV